MKWGDVGAGRSAGARVVGWSRVPGRRWSRLGAVGLGSDEWAAALGFASWAPGSDGLVVVADELPIYLFYFCFNQIN